MIKRIKSFHLVLATSLCLVVLAAGTSLAEDVLPCTADIDSVPIQVVRVGGAEGVTTLSEGKINSTLIGFSDFVQAITEHLAVRLAQKKICVDSAESRKRSLLQFMPWVVNARPRTSLPQLDARPLGFCRISSPWIDLVVERKPVPSVRGIVRYNQRQLLADQAVLAGAPNVPPGVAMPLSYDELRRYADLEYAPSEIRHEPAEKPIEERVPPDLLWLFRRTDPGTGYDFSGNVLGYAGLAMSTGSESYTKIVIALIDHCFESEGEDIHYSNILDVADLFPLEQYRIDELIPPALPGQ